MFVTILMQKYAKKLNSDNQREILHKLFVHGLPKSSLFRNFALHSESVNPRPNHTINVGGRLLDLSSPLVMGILNATPDSFYAASRVQTERAIAERADAIVAQGGAIIDVGACSTRPGATAVSAADEMARLRTALAVVRRRQPDAVVSVDTFRPDVARMAVEEYGATIVNDVSEGGNGTLPPMFEMVARLRVPYILTSVRPDLRTMLLAFAQEVALLKGLGVADIILDPGFGFGKTLEQNYLILDQLDRLHTLGLPLLVGLSRKSMVTKTLGCSPDEALPATSALHAAALERGAAILRVHDVGEAVGVCRVMAQLDAAHCHNNEKTAENE